MKVMMYCAAGKHEGPEIGTQIDAASEGAAPHGWSLVPVHREGDRWVYFADSDLMAWRCPHHAFPGEPGSN